MEQSQEQQKSIGRLSTPAWIEALKQKSMPELQARLLYLEHMAFLLTEAYNGKTITDVNIWIDSVDKCSPVPVEDLQPQERPETGWGSFNIKFVDRDIPETFRQFIHDFCTSLCAEKLVVESLIDRG